MTEIFFFGPDNNQVEAEGAVKKKFSMLNMGYTELYALKLSFSFPRVKS